MSYILCFILHLRIRWPAIIYNPSVIPDSFKPIASPFLGRKHCIYYYATGDWGLASPAQVTNFAVHLEVNEFRQEVPPDDRATYVEAVRLGREDMWESRQDRVAWNHEGDGGRKTRLLKVAKTLLKHRWSEIEVGGLEAVGVLCLRLLVMVFYILCFFFVMFCFTVLCCVG
jgi:hypothetical protein